MKATSHEQVSSIAIDIFCKHDQSAFSKALKKERFMKLTLWGVKDEDGLNPSRALNWHFFPANETIAKQEVELVPFPRIAISPTSLGIMSYRQTQVMGSIEGGASDWLFQTLGRVLHHIQDMSTPSHVVPVYHGPKIDDPYEQYLVSKWEFLLQGMNASDPVISNALSVGMSGDFVSIYRTAANRLRDNLYSGAGLFPVTVGGNGNTVSAQEFWKEYDGTGKAGKGDAPFGVIGFGSFGALGCAYGESTPIVSNGASITVDDDVFFKVARFFVSHAIADTIRTFRLLSQIVDNTYQGQSFVNESNPFLDGT